MVAMVGGGYLSVTTAQRDAGAASLPPVTPVSSGPPSTLTPSASASTVSTPAAPASPPAASPSAPAASVPAAGVQPAPVVVPTVTTPSAGTTSTEAAAVVPPTPAVTAVTPQELGTEALALVRYPWQSIPGYSIQFLPISQAPSPGFLGNTSFTWGTTGGVSTLYVYPGETATRLAGIIGFEIGHEVDAAYVEPSGGHAQIESILGIQPASWAPTCDCAEQGYLSGWYAAAFSAYWSPGVGNWSTLAPMPTGATLKAVTPWLDPTTL